MDLPAFDRPTRSTIICTMPYLDHSATYDFRLVVSMGDLVHYFGEGDDDVVGHPSLQAACSAAGLRVDLAALYLEYFDHIRVGEGDMCVFRRAPADSTMFAIDLYRERTDQLDIVALAFTCATASMPALRFHLRRFFDTAQYPIAFEEGPHLPRARQMADATLYPREYVDNGHPYPQNLRQVIAPLAPEG
ncbi:hypothetical protein [Stenotrophomonas sp.]|uniref:hypothetical protein n=1 Tax=Stenotrophomonas sp. TaxID=69392 RepID=UPI0028A94960|nr:hypothetical protein [Stenotrophomonas sp.]